MSKFKFSILSSAAVLAAAAASNAAILTLGTSSSAAPTSTPTITVAPGGAVSLYLYGSAQGSGYLQSFSAGLYESSASSFAGGVVSATNALAGATALTGVSATYSPTYASNFAYQPAGYAPTYSPTITGATALFTGLKGINTGTPPSPVGATPVEIASITGTASTTPGTYYLYLGATTGGVAESPAYAASSYIKNGTGAVTGTTQFGFGGSAVATAGGGFAVNMLNTVPTAIIVVQAAGPTFSVGPVTSPTTTITGNNVSYKAAVLGSNGSFTMGGTPAGNILVALDLSGQSSYTNFFGSSLPAGDTDVSAQYASLFTSLLGGSYDVVISIPATQSGTVTIGGLPAGVTLNSIAVVPEPTSLAGLALLGVPALARRRRE